MKKLFLFMACVAMSVLAMSQDNQLVWANGRLLYGTPIESIDSLTYDEMQDIDTLHLLLPRTLIKVVHDTVYIHDTVYVETDCGGEGDTPTEPEEPENTENGYEYVDLGLSVKWATCNVGATKPEEYGDYFAWGETEPKEVYDWSTYKWCNGSSSSLTKYCTNSSYGTVDNKTTLDLSDDAARANWGGSWRMPTDAELTELRTECTWTWTTENGVNGYKVTSKSNGNSIFLPAAGRYENSSLGNTGSGGSFLSSALLTDYSGSAFVLNIFSSSVYSSGLLRHYGQSVRPVCQ